MKVVFVLRVIFLCSQALIAYAQIRTDIRVPDTKNISEIIESDEIESTEIVNGLEKINPALFAPKVFSCQHIKALNPNAKSGVYSININSLIVNVFCEMDIDNGGYTFFSRGSLLNGVVKQALNVFYNRKNVLLYFKNKNNKIKYGVVGQLSDTNNQNLLLEVEDNVGIKLATKCKNAINSNTIGYPFLCLEFQNVATASRTDNDQGFEVNGDEITFRNCDGNPNSYMAFFPRFNNPSPLLFTSQWPFLDSFLDKLSFHPWQNNVPKSVFHFFEMLFGGCGVYTSTDGRSSMRKFTSVAVGFK